MYSAEMNSGRWPQRWAKAAHRDEARRLGLRRDLPLSTEHTAALDGWLWPHALWPARGFALFKLVGVDFE
jgi:hypothetical protein